MSRNSISAMANLPTFLYLGNERVGRVVDFGANEERGVFEIVFRSDRAGVAVISATRYTWSTTDDEIHLIVLETGGLIG